MNPAPSDPAEDLGRILAYARRRLGPASEKLLLNPAQQAVVLHRMRSGWELEDAVLNVVHAAAAADRQVADEFLAHLLLDLHRIGQAVISPGLRRYLDTGDLVQSVLGDLWQDLASARFETRKQFLAFLTNSLRWKTSDRARQLGAGKRREDLRSGRPPEELPLAAGGASPSSIAGEQEEHERLILILAQLPERDRVVLSRHLQGRTLAEIGLELRLSEDTARKAVQAAMERARALARNRAG